jgi:cell division protein FtsN
MKKDVSRVAALLPGKAVLMLITVAAATAGFSLGYFVGKSVSPSPDPSMLKQPAGNDLASVPATPNPLSGLKDEASSSPMPQMHPSPPEGSQASVPPSRGGAAPFTADLRNEEKISAKGQKTAMTEKKDTPAPGEHSALPAGVPNPDKAMMYTVQAAAFKHQKDADALRHILVDKGYNVTTRKEPDPKGTVLFKVWVGEFEQKKDASVFALKLRKTDGLNAFVVVKH